MSPDVWSYLGGPILIAIVLGPNSRQFKRVFDLTQAELESKFGMTLTELPSKEKVTIQQKRAAQRTTGNTQGGSSSSKSYVLTSTLPPALRVPSILSPPKVPTAQDEASYVGFYSVIVGIIYLSQGGRISESKLERHLERANAKHYVFNDKTEKILKRMEREGYIVKIRDREPGGEETVDWVVGPRGKVEIGENGVAHLVRGVYENSHLDIEELQEKLESSLGVGTFKKFLKKSNSDNEAEDISPEHQGNAQGAETRTRSAATRPPGSTRQRRNGAEDKEDDPRPRRRSSRRGVVDNEDDEDDDEEDEEDE